MEIIMIEVCDFVLFFFVSTKNRELKKSLMKKVMRISDGYVYYRYKPIIKVLEDRELLKRSIILKTNRNK